MDRSRQVRAGFQLSQHQTITGRTPRQGIFPRAEPAPGHGSALHGGQVPYSVKGCYLEVALSGEFRSDTGVDFWDIRLLVLRFPLLLRFLPAWVVPHVMLTRRDLGFAFARGFAVVADSLRGTRCPLVRGFSWRSHVGSQLSQIVGPGVFPRLGAGRGFTGTATTSAWPGEVLLPRGWPRVVPRVGPRVGPRSWS